MDCILFDWGGTLASVAGQSAALERGASEVVQILLGHEDPAAVISLAAEASAAEHEAAKHPELREANLREMLKAWVGRRGEPCDEHMIRAAEEAICRHWVGSALHPLPGAVEALRTLKERGYRMGLVSNVWIPPDHCRRELEIQGFMPYLDFAVFSGEVGYRKPSPHIYEAALSHAGNGRRVDDLSRVLFVGDSPHFDCMTPARMGMRTALVESAPGFWPAADRAEAQPDVIIDSVSELPDLLQ